MSVLDPAQLEWLRIYAAADLDDQRTRDNVTAAVLQLLPDLVETVEYWQTLALERLDGIDHDNAWPLCRCERDLVCAGCDRTPDECDCSSVTDEIAAAIDEDGDLPDDPLARVLLGAPSGICCLSCHPYQGKEAP